MLSKNGEVCPCMWGEHQQEGGFHTHSKRAYLGIVSAYPTRCHGAPTTEQIRPSSVRGQSAGGTRGQSRRAPGIMPRKDAVFPAKKRLTFHHAYVKVGTHT